MSDETQTQGREEQQKLLETRINDLECEIINYHVPRAIRPVGYTIISTFPILGSLAIHSIWNYLSPETHESGAAELNHVLAGAIFFLYNGMRFFRGDFQGLAKKTREYFHAEHQLNDLKKEYEKIRKTYNGNKNGKKIN